MKRLLLMTLTLLSPSLVQAQPADDPGLSEPAPKPTPPPTPRPTTPPPTTAPHSDASATVMAPHDEALTGSAETHETVDTQVTWLDTAGPATGDDDLYARLAAPTV